MTIAHFLRTFRAALPRARELALATVVLSMGCGDGQSDATRSSFYPTDARDEDASPDVVAVTLRAGHSEHELVPGRASTLQTYSGALPGPLIRAKRGDTLHVHFENELEQPTTIHWHGVRVPNAMDGVPGMTQPLIAPHESFDYSFPLPDAGLFWYHPHNDSVGTVAAGLYGALLVTDPDDPPELGDDVVIVLSDAKVDATGVLVPRSPDLAAPLSDKEGNVVLVNGQVYPTLSVTNGRRQRWHVLNAAASRYFQLATPMHTFVQIGANSGLDEYPVEVEHPVLAPGERLDLLITPRGTPGLALDVNSLPYARARSLEKTPAQALFRMEFTDGGVASAPELPTWPSPLTAVDTASAERVALDLTMSDADGALQWGINGAPFAEHAAVHAHVGTTQVFVIENKSPFSHPFHFHGFFFQVLDEDGNATRPLSLRDTLDVPPLSRRQLAVTYDDRPGMWMFHCHILDHAENGMMGMVHLEP